MESESQSQLNQEQLGHLIITLQTFLDGLQAAGPLGTAARAEQEAEARKLIEAYESRHEKLSGPDFESIADIPASLAKSLADARKRIQVLIEHGWPEGRVRPNPA